MFWLSHCVIGLLAFDTAVAARYSYVVSTSSAEGADLSVLASFGMSACMAFPETEPRDLETRGKLRASTSSLALYFQTAAMRFR